MSIDLKPTQFRARVNDINQVTVMANIREKFGIQPQDEIILEYIGWVSKKETIIEPKEVPKKRGK